VEEGAVPRRSAYKRAMRMSSCSCHFIFKLCKYITVCDSGQREMPNYNSYFVDAVESANIFYSLSPLSLFISLSLSFVRGYVTVLVCVGFYYVCDESPGLYWLRMCV
jgi:hypothetical protein